MITASVSQLSSDLNFTVPNEAFCRNSGMTYLSLSAYLSLGISRINWIRLKLYTGRIKADLPSRKTHNKKPKHEMNKNSVSY